MFYPFADNRILTVSELTEMISDVMDANFDYLCVEGEVSNLRTPSSGHCYFTLKDEKSQIRSVLFRGAKQFVPFDIEDGQKLICFGKIGLYAPRGEYQIIVEQLEPAGLGSLHLAFEQLKIKLEADGLFDEGRKKPIPPLPKRIGIVTSPTGAAIRDILNVLERRNATVNVLIAPATVQGEGAATEIARAIELLDEEEEVDVIIAGRGGGSVEDLWSFNEEIVARAIFNATTPIISAVGHERDFTISDFVADLRAPTPSAAAELVSKSAEELSRNISNLNERMTRTILSKLSLLKEYLGNEKRALKDPRKKLSDARMRIDELAWKIEKMVREKTGIVRSELNGLAGRLDSISPLAVLARGYSITTSIPEGKIISNASQVKRDEKVSVKLQKGRLTCLILGKSEENNRPK